MAGIAASLTTVGLDEAIAKLSRLGGFQMSELADDAGAILESSTRARFDAGEAPDGSAWAEWSDDYASTRRSHHSLLVGEGDLRDSIASFSNGFEAHVGTNQIYGAHHQIGGEDIGSGIPARPFLGVSDEDELDIKDLVTGRLGEIFQ